MTADNFQRFLENAASALLLMLFVLVVWIILKRMSSAMRKDVIAAQSALVDGLIVNVERGVITIAFNVPQGWSHPCHVRILDASRGTVKILNAAPLDSGLQSFTCDASELEAAFISLETAGQKLERRLF